MYRMLVNKIYDKIRFGPILVGRKSSENRCSRVVVFKSFSAGRLTIPLLFRRRRSVRVFLVRRRVATSTSAFASDNGLLQCFRVFDYICIYILWWEGLKLNDCFIFQFYYQLFMRFLYAPNSSNDLPTLTSYEYYSSSAAVTGVIMTSLSVLRLVRSRLVTSPQTYDRNV